MLRTPGMRAILRLDPARAFASTTLILTTKPALHVNARASISSFALLRPAVPGRPQARQLSVQAKATLTTPAPKTPAKQSSAEARLPTKTKPKLICQRCGKDRVLEVLMGFKVEQAEFMLRCLGKESSEYEGTPNRLFCMEKGAPFCDPDGGNDARIAICLGCGQTQGKFPTTNPLECVKEEQGKNNKNCDCVVCESRR